MTEPYATHEAQEEAEATTPYIRIWVVLLVLTVLEYFYAKIMAGNMTSLIAGLLLLAGIKAGLVGLYFMHVKYEGKWVYAIMVPVGILATIVVLGLIPDIATPHENPMTEAEETAWSAPLNPSDGWDASLVRV